MKANNYNDKKKYIMSKVKKAFAFDQNKVFLFS
jgi:hypothetical protein